ncbi:hypothetical protein [Arenibaculum pallidiluteum]|uniref:hypothetical protein n=1 Tax=Arenibaculum pallidiluteum TaxID=2812559 RepID=UPI001A97B26D|nr:hypothetical protein [Arenibaculum pallidiluteum]
MAQAAVFICRPYMRGRKGGLQPCPAFAAASAEAACRRGERLLAGDAGFVGVDVLQVEHGESGAWDEPVVLARLGQVPELPG